MLMMRAAGNFAKDIPALGHIMVALIENDEVEVVLGKIGQPPVVGPALEAAGCS